MRSVITGSTASSFHFAASSRMTWRSLRRITTVLLVIEVSRRPARTVPRRFPAAMSPPTADRTGARRVDQGASRPITPVPVLRVAVSLRPLSHEPLLSSSFRRHTRPSLALPARLGRRGDGQIHHQHFFPALAVCSCQDIPLSVEGYTAALAGVLPALTDAVRHDHRCANLSCPHTENRKIRQSAAIVGVEHQLRPQRLRPLDAAGRLSISADEARCHNAIYGKSFRAAARIVPGVLVSISLVLFLPP